MRWTPKRRPVPGDIKRVRKFLLWPRNFGAETRWLEWATIEYRRCWDRDDFERWYAQRFVEETQ